MKLQTKLKYSLIVPSALVMLLPLTAFAQTALHSGLDMISEPFGGGFSAQTPQELIVQIINIMLLFAGIIAVIFIIIGGYRYIISNGNEEAAEKGRNTMVNAIIGIIIISLAYVIVNVITNFFSGGSFF